MTSPRHDEAMTTPAVVAMTAWMEDTSLRNNTTQLIRGGKFEYFGPDQNML